MTPPRCLFLNRTEEDEEDEEDATIHHQPSATLGLKADVFTFPRWLA